jgi:hypothetical protein
MKEVFAYGGLFSFMFLIIIIFGWAAHKLENED